MTLSQALFVEPYHNIKITYPPLLIDVAEVTTFDSHEEAFNAVIRDPTRYCFISAVSGLSPESHEGLNLLEKIREVYAGYNRKHSRHKLDPVRILVSGFVFPEDYMHEAHEVTSRGGHGLIIKPTVIDLLKGLIRAAAENKPRDEVERMILDQYDEPANCSKGFNPAARYSR